jgi:hypothetical protein
MDKTLIYGLFQTLTVSAAGRYPEHKISKNKLFTKKFLLKINEIFLKINVSKTRLLVSAAGR